MNVKVHHTLDKLLTLYKTEMNPRLARRIQAIYLARKSFTCSQIMDMTGAKRRTVHNWIRWYNDWKIDGLKDRPRSGRPPKLSVSQQRQLCKRLDGGTTKSDRIRILNGPAIQRILAQEFGVLYCLNGVYELLHRLGYSCLCPRPKHEQGNPQAQAAFKKTSLNYWKRSKPGIPTRESKFGSKMKPDSASKGH